MSFLAKLFGLKAACPSCGEILKKKPKRKGKCAVCGEAIFVEDGRLLSMAQVRERKQKEAAQRLREQLIGYQKAGVIKDVQARTVNDRYVCDHCRSVAGQVMSVEQALKKMPIPHGCTGELGCRCFWIAVVK